MPEFIEGGGETREIYTVSLGGLGNHTQDFFMCFFVSGFKIFVKILVFWDGVFTEITVIKKEK